MQLCVCVLHVLKSELSYCPSRLTKLLSCHFHVKHVGQAGCIIIPDCKGFTQAFMQFVLGDNRDFGVLSAYISIWKSSSCDMSPRRGSPAAWIVFCIAASLPCFKPYTNKVHLNTFHAATLCQLAKERREFLKISPCLCVCLFFLSLPLLHCRALEPFPAALGRSYGYTLGRSPWTATIHTHIHTYRHFRGAN